jgi:hypothetical protein
LSREKGISSTVKKKFIHFEINWLNLLYVNKHFDLPDGKLRRYSVEQLLIVKIKNYLLGNN